MQSFGRIASTGARSPPNARDELLWCSVRSDAQVQVTSCVAEDTDHASHIFQLDLQVCAEYGFVFRYFSTGPRSPANARSAAEKNGGKAPIAARYGQCADVRELQTLSAPRPRSHNIHCRQGGSNLFPPGGGRLPPLASASAVGARERVPNHWN